MGFKVDAFLIKPTRSISNEEILADLGHKNVLLNRSTAKNGQFGFRYSLVVGRHPNFLIVFGQNSQDSFASQSPSAVEKHISEKYNDCQILAMFNYETSNSYLYNYIENGKRIRLKLGGHGEGIMINFGELLPEEIEPYDKVEGEDIQQIFHKKYEYQHPHTKELVSKVEEYSHDQVGGSAAFALSARIMGNRYDQDWAEGVEFFEYIPAARLDQLPPITVDFLNTIHVRSSILSRGVFLINPYLEKVETLLSPLLEKHGFSFDKTTLRYQRTINEITQTFSLADTTNIGNHLVTPTPRFQIETPHLLNWWLQEFGTDQMIPNNDRSKITSLLNIPFPAYLDKREVEVHGQLGKLSLEQMIMILKTYVEDSLLPFLNHNSTLENLAHATGRPFPKMEFLISLNQNEEAKWALHEYLVALEYPNYKKEYQPLVDRAQNRMERFFPDTKLEDFLNIPKENIKWNTWKIPTEKIIIDIRTTEEPKVEVPTISAKKKKTAPTSETPKEKDYKTIGLWDLFKSFFEK